MVPRRLDPKEDPRPLTTKLKESFAHVRRTLRLVRSSSAPMTVALAAMTLLGGVVPLGIAYVGKRIVDAVVAHSRDAIWHWVLLELALVVAFSPSCSAAAALVRSLLGARLGIDINVIHPHEGARPRSAIPFRGSLTFTTS